MVQTTLPPTPPHPALPHPTQSHPAPPYLTPHPTHNPPPPGLPSLPEALQHYLGLEAASFELFAACNEAGERITAMTREARELEAEVRQMEVSRFPGGAPWAGAGGRGRGGGWGWARSGGAGDGDGDAACGLRPAKTT